MQNGYCNQCDRHCSLDQLSCGRGYRAMENGHGREGVMGGGFRALEGREGGMTSGFKTLPRRPEEGMDRRFHRGGDRYGARPPMDFDGHGFDRDFGGHGFDGHERDFGSHDFDVHNHGFDGHERNFGGPGHGGPGGPGFGGPGGPGGRGHGPGGHGPGGRGRGGRSPFGKQPIPDADMLRERIAGADLAELFELAGRLLHHGPVAGPARGQALILAILSGREDISQRELQQMLGVQPGSMSEIVSKLERKGLVTRERGEDRRGNLLRITDAGREAAAQAQQSPDDALFSALTDPQQDTLAGLLRTLLTDWASRFGAQPRTLPLRPGDEGGLMTLEERHPIGPDGEGFTPLDARKPGKGPGVPV